MTKSIYVAAPEGNTGKSVIALGILDALLREVGSVGVFRPLVKSGQRDQILETLLSVPGIVQEYDQAVGVTYDDVRRDADEALANLVARYGSLQGKFKTILILGSDYTDVSSPTELAFNARVATNLNAPIVLVVSGKDRSPEQVKNAAESALAEVRAQHNEAFAVIANRVAPELMDETLTRLREIPNEFTAALPAQMYLSAVPLRRQFEAVGAELVFGREELLDHETQDTLVAGMTLPNVLARLVSESTIVVPADRTDIIVGVLQAHRSGSFPQLTGMILVGGYELPEVIVRLIEGLDVDLPIGATTQGTYHTALQLFALEGGFTSSPRKVEIARRIFSENVDGHALLEALDVKRSEIRTPLMFEYQLMELARKNRQRIVMPESADDRILESASILVRRGVADLILLGNPLTIKRRANQNGWGLDDVTIVDPTDPELVEKFAEEYARLRAHKGVTVEQAREKLKDLSYFGTMMVHFGMADGMVSGAINTTANTIRPSLEFIKTRPGVKVVSGAFLMCLADRVVVYADCAVNPDPSAEELADIAISSAETAEAFGIEPRVAMLSYSTGTSGFGADVDKVRTATEIVRGRRPDLALEGPIQFDAAVDPDVARTKLPNSPVAGKATVFIFPDLNTGNNTYKAVQRSSGAVAVGPVLQGLNKAVNDLSRGATVDDIVNTVAITAIQAAQGASA
ncbi:MAG TPA: phosphate acetyltransferase [Propionibacteriaceae bacterium]|nr:phosphate acetyltransferase [Propionibacteriaceae bacterium]